MVEERIQGGHWKLFAFMVTAMAAMADLPKFSHPGDEQPLFLFMSGLDIAAAIGLIGYAYGTPILPRIVWRIVGPLFALSCIAQFSATGTEVAPTIQHQGGIGLLIFCAIMTPPAMIGVFASIGLLRHAGWLETPST